MFMHLKGGKRMKKICPSCGAENEVAAKFCMNCATKFTEETTESITEEKEVIASEKENKEDIPMENNEQRLCPECKKIIDMDAKECPECGYKLEQVLEEDSDKDKTDKKSIKCPECGEVLSKKEKVCHKCGYVIKKGKKGKVVGGIIIAVVVLFGIICFSNYNQQKKAEAERQQKIEQQEKAKKKAEEELESYKSSFELAVLCMQIGSFDAQQAGGLVHDVWYDTIYNRDESDTRKYVSGHSDFNDSLDALFKDSDFQEKITSLKNSQETARNYMKSLTNPPDEYKQGYEALLEFYNDYVTFTNLAIDPTGNLTSYTQSFNETVSAISTDIETMKLYTDIDSEE